MDGGPEAATTSTPMPGGLIIGGPMGSRDPSHSQIELPGLNLSQREAEALAVSGVLQASASNSHGQNAIVGAYESAGVAHRGQRQQQQHMLHANVDGPLIKKSMSQMSDGVGGISSLGMMMEEVVQALATGELAWHDVEAVPVKDPVTGKNVRGGRHILVET